MGCFPDVHCLCHVGQDDDVPVTATLRPIGIRNVWDWRLEGFFGVP